MNKGILSVNDLPHQAKQQLEELLRSLLSGPYAPNKRLISPLRYSQLLTVVARILTEEVSWRPEQGNVFRDIITTNADNALGNLKFCQGDQIKTTYEIQKTSVGTTAACVPVPGYGLIRWVIVEVSRDGRFSYQPKSIR